MKNWKSNTFWIVCLLVTSAASSYATYRWTFRVAIDYAVKGATEITADCQTHLTECVEQMQTQAVCEKLVVICKEAEEVSRAAAERAERNAMISAEFHKRAEVSANTALMSGKACDLSNRVTREQCEKEKDEAVQMCHLMCKTAIAP